MITLLTEDQLDAIEARTNAATAGPWGFYDGDNYADVAADMQMTGPGSYSYREKVARLEDEDYWDDQAHEDHDEERAPEQMTANAAFIAHARTDVPALLAEVRPLRSERDELRRKFADAAASLAEQILRYGKRQREHNADREELERLRAELAREERLHSSTIADRDRASDAADRLAYAVAAEDVIGEHTADNSPWANALELITSAADVDKLRDELTVAIRPSTPRLCICGHSNQAHVPAPHSCFAHGQTCPCPAYRQLPHDEAEEQFKRNLRAAEERAQEQESAVVSAEAQR